MNADVLCRELGAARLRIAELESEVAALRRAAVPEQALALRTAGGGLSAREARLVAYLAAGGPRSRRQIAVALGLRDLSDESINETIKKIRRKVGNGLTIMTVYGVGYQLDDDSASRVRAILRAAL